MMYKRILSGLAAFIILFGTASYLPTDSFGSGAVSASAYNMELDTETEKYYVGEYDLDDSMPVLISGDSIDLMYNESDSRGFFAEKQIFTAESWDDVYALGEVCIQVSDISTSVNDNADIDFGDVRYYLIAKSSDDGAVPTVIDLNRDTDSTENKHIFTADADTLNPNGYNGFDGLYLALIDGNSASEAVKEGEPEFHAEYRFLKFVSFEDIYEYESVDEDSDEIRITALKDGINTSDIIIPYEINGSRIVEIGADAFKDKDLASADIRACLDVIGERAFEGNPRLNYLHINNSDCIIEDYAVGYNDDENTNSKFVLEGEIGSTAETYASENGLKFEDQVPYDEIGFNQKLLCEVGSILKADNKITDNDIALKFEFDSSLFSENINWSDIEAFRKLFMSAVIYRTYGDLDPSDFYAAFYTVDSQDNAFTGTKFDFDENGKIRMIGDVTKELFGVGENEQIQFVGIMFGLKETSLSKIDTSSETAKLAAFRINAEYNNNDYISDPDFVFPDVDADLRDDISDNRMIVAKNPESIEPYESGYSSYFSDWKYRDIYSEQFWAVQAHLTNLDNGIRPTDLVISIYGKDKNTGTITDYYSADFDENGYAIVQGDIGYSVIKRNAWETVGEFGYRIHAKDDILNGLDEDMKINVEYQTRIFNKDLIPDTDDGILVKLVNEEGYSGYCIFSGSYDSLLARKHLKITAKVDHLPDDITYSDLCASLRIRSSADPIAFSYEILKTAPDDEGNILIEADITDELFNKVQSKHKEIKIAFNTVNEFDSEQYSGYDYVILNYSTEFEGKTTTVTEGDYELEVFSDGSGIITGYNGNDTEITIPSVIGDYNITEIGDEAFAYKDFTKVTVSEGIKLIGSAAFTFDEDLKEIDLPESLTSVGEFAFENTGLTKITVPQNVTEIGQGAFLDCSALTEASLSDGLTDLGEYAFSGCTQLSSVNIPTSLKEISNGVFCNTALESVELPESVSSIGFNAFTECQYLKKITMSENVCEIWDEAFSGCSSLESIDLPKSLDKIKPGVFKDSGLKHIVIPTNVSEIYSDAFIGCNDLDNIVILNKDAAVLEVSYWDFDSDQPANVLLGGENSTVRCYEGSVPERYAQQNGIQFKAISENDGGFDAPEYEWSEDHSKVTASSFCYLEPSASITETVDSSAQTYGPTCAAEGYTEYSAEFTNNKFTKQTERVSGDAATGIHSEAEPVVENLNAENGEYDLVVYCSVCGEEISRTHIVPEVKLRKVGDINGDGKISTDDAIIAARMAANFSNYQTRFSSKAADINGDGNVTADDAIIIARYSAGYSNYRERYDKTIPESEL